MDRDIEAALVQRETIAEWLASLTDAQREAVRLVWIEGYTQEEAAERLGITRQGVAKHLALARNHAPMVAKHPSK
jgi:RNA polymerase sigma factor (sigma-70 family)